MNFDKIKAAWEQEGEGQAKLPENLLKGKKSPIRKIRNNMRMEFVAQGIGILLLAFFPAIFGMQAVYVVPYYIVYGFYSGIVIYYLIRFYFFFRRLHDNSLNSKDSIYTLYYDTRLNIEIYRTFNYCLVPIGLALMFMFLFDTFKIDTYLSREQLLIGGAFTVVISMALIVAGVELWIRDGYGKYLQVIKKVMEELREESVV
jgi:hypothetical protein